MSEISIYVDSSEIRKAIGNIEGADEVVEELKAEGAALVQYRMYQNAPKFTTFLARSIVMRFYPDGFEVLPTAFYTLFVERGTGLFGPKRSLIFPKKAKVLRWFSFGKPIFAKYTKGQWGKWFIKKTDEETSGPVRELAERLWVGHHLV